MKKLAIALGIALIAALAGCSSSSSGAGNPPPSTPATTSSPQPIATGAAGIAAATAQIKANWTTFFASTTPHATAVSLLQNGANLGPAVKIAAKIAKADKTKESAKVTKITFAANGMSAAIQFTLFGNGKPLLKKSPGTAVLVDGQWKVAQLTFCDLVDLGAGSEKVPGC